LIDGSLTLFSSSSVMDGSQPAASGELHPRPAVVPCDLRRLKLPRHPLILDGFFPTSRLPTSPFGFVGRPVAGNCACTFYLVFKEPAFPRCPFWPQFLRLGNLTRLFQTSQPCQCLFFGSRTISRKGVSWKDNPKGD
jgi:hypothetical protein